MTPQCFAIATSIFTAGKYNFYMLLKFRMFDKDGLGRVSASDLGSMMKSLGKHPTTEELQGILLLAHI